MIAQHSTCTAWGVRASRDSACARWPCRSAVCRLCVAFVVTPPSLCLWLVVCVSGAKRKENELRRVFAVKLKEAKTEADAAMERLRRQHHTEMNTLRQAREVHTITTYHTNTSTSTRHSSNVEAQGVVSPPRWLSPCPSCQGPSRLPHVSLCLCLCLCQCVSRSVSRSTTVR